VIKLNIIISDEIIKLTEAFKITAFECDVEIYKNLELDSFIDSLEHDISKEYDISDVIQIPKILDGRNAYKKYGKDPSRYRLAVESLFRRLSKGNRLYRINNVVDTGNVLSLILQKSTAILDYDKIVGNVQIRLGTSKDEYYGIGRGLLNIDRIPLYEDNLGPFGSVTSDTERTMISPNTKKILVFIISFTHQDDLKEDYKIAKDIFTRYCNASNFKKHEVS